MKINRIVIVLLTAAVLVLSVVVAAQVRRPYRNGSVWAIQFIRMKPGMERAYLDFLVNDWKREQEELKKAGQTLSYKVLATESHGPDDFNIMLMSEYRDMAAMTANEDNEDALGQRLFGDDEKQRKAYRDRLEIREILGDRVAQEIVLEPKQP